MSCFRRRSCFFPRKRCCFSAITCCKPSWPPCPFPPFPNAFDFSFQKMNLFGSAIPNAEFELTHLGGGFVQSATSAIDGSVNFTDIAPGFYEMQETLTPGGYISNNAVYAVNVDFFGNVLIDGVDASQFIVYNISQQSERFGQ